MADSKHSSATKKEILGAGGIVWVEYRDGMFVPKTSLAAYQAAKARRATSKAYLDSLRVQGVKLPKLF